VVVTEQEGPPNGYCRIRPASEVSMKTVAVIPSYEEEGSVEKTVAKPPVRGPRWL